MNIFEYAYLWNNYSFHNNIYLSILNSYIMKLLNIKEIYFLNFNKQFSYNQLTYVLNIINELLDWPFAI